MTRLAYPASVIERFAVAGPPPGPADPTAAELRQDEIDEAITLVEPSAPLDLTTHIRDEVPTSIGVDGWVYAVDGNTIVRTDDVFASVDVGATFSDPPEWVTRTTDGYSVVTLGDDDTGAIWFSTSFTTGFSKLQDTRNVRRNVGISRPELADGHTLIVFGEYAQGPDPRDLYVTTDGGQTVELKRSLVLNNPAINAHWHSAVYDPLMHRLWACAGDGPNAWIGFSDDHGDTWTVLESGNNVSYRQPTVMADLSYGILTSPDSGPGRGGINRIHPVTTAPLGSMFQADDADAPSQQFGVSPYAQNGRHECYISIPPKNAADKVFYVVGTGDGGRTWHVVHERVYDSDGPWSREIIGPDLNDTLYLRRISGGETGFQTADLVTWIPTP